MDIRLLGSIEAWDADRLLYLGPRKQRLAFAILALEVNRLVTVSRLVALTWGDSPPATARHAIHVRMSALRGILTAATCQAPAEVEIVTRGSAYMLSANADAIDVHRFRSLVAAASGVADVERVDRLRLALELWRGPPLVDVVTPNVSDQLCRGLEETWLKAAEECYDAELRLGRHSAVVDELTALAARFPLRHRLQAQLMLALYRSGRGPEALQAYHKVRSRLSDEYGLDPDRSLRRLQGAILREDPQLDGQPGQPVLVAGAVAESSSAGTDVAADSAAHSLSSDGSTDLAGKQQSTPSAPNEDARVPEPGPMSVPDVVAADPFAAPAADRQPPVKVPLGQHPVIADAALAFLLTSTVIAALWLASGPLKNALNALGSPIGQVRSVWLAAGVLSCLPLVFRRRYPLIVLVIVAFAFAIFRLDEASEHAFVAIPVLVAFYSAGVYARPVRYGAWVRATVLAVVGVTLTASPFDIENVDLGALRVHELRLASPMRLARDLVVDLLPFTAATLLGDAVRRSRRGPVELVA
jgi:DNA-binding SARP family transcriptional activator